MRTIICLACVALLAACSGKSTPSAPPVQPSAAATVVASTPPHKPSTAEKIDEMLMKAVFGDQYRPVSSDALATLTDYEERGKRAQFVVRAVANTVLATGETVLVAEANYAEADGTAQASHATGGLLNVFLLRQVDGKWQILKRHENITMLGSHGFLGEVIWTKLATDKPGLAVINGGVWQGYSVRSLALFDLSADVMHDLAPAGIQMHSSSDGACDPEETTECWEVNGKWRMQAAKSAAMYDDIVVDFTGEKSTLAPRVEGQAPTPRVSTPVAGTARYAYDGKRYQLVEGENLVPSV